MAVREPRPKHASNRAVHLPLACLIDQLGAKRQRMTVVLDGKTRRAVADLIVARLGLEIARIGLGAVVGKYIGDTEKHLDRLFAEVEKRGAVLLIDEADALFGKRSEVKDNHDRYANIGTNYLLQRLEAFKGIAILATDRRANLDPALLRRLRHVVEWPPSKK